MPTKILKSRIASIPDFAAAVKLAAQERTQWRAHMANVGRDPNTHTPYPQPQPHPEVGRAIAEVPGKDGEPETYAPDYEIVDDSPPPEAILRQKKNVLIEIVSRLEAHAATQVSPPGKRRYRHMLEVDLRNADRKRAEDFAAEHDKKRQERIKKIAAKKRDDPIELEKAMGPDLTADEVNAVVAKARSSEDAAFLADQDAEKAKLEAIARHGAKLHHDIEDLASVEDVDKFQIPPFPV